MSFLNDTQLRELKSYLQATAKRHTPLQEELLDHLACLIEERMAAGADYLSAKNEALQFLTKDEVKRTEGKTLYFIHTKPVLMKVFSFFGLIGLIGLASMFFPHHDAVVHTHELPAPATPQQVQPQVVLVSEIEPPAIAPLEGNHSITFDYGTRVHPILKEKRLHRGIDFKAPMGTPIRATADGVITFAAEEHNYGLKIVIQHDDHFESLYAHMSEIKVKAGDQVKKGTIIGLVGNTGLSTAPHLHYEVLKDGKPVNPADYLPKT